MKKLLPILILLSAAPLLFADTASVWATLDIQTDSMAQAVADKNVSILQELDHVISDEVAGLHRDPTLPPEVAPLLGEIAKQSTTTFHAGQQNDWKLAAENQTNFARAVKAAEAAAAPQKK